MKIYNKKVNNVNKNAANNKFIFKKTYIQMLAILNTNALVKNKVVIKKLKK